MTTDAKAKKLNIAKRTLRHLNVRSGLQTGASISGGSYVVKARTYACNEPDSVNTSHTTSANSGSSL